jgi:hypothetical protein
VAAGPDDSGRHEGQRVPGHDDRADFLGDGVTAEELGITSLRETAARRLGEPLTWWWTYRVRLAIR